MNDVKYYCPPKPPYGAIRRSCIKNWFLSNPQGMLVVNCRYRPQLKFDADLTKLIKSKFLIRIRVHTSIHHARPFLVLNPLHCK